MSWTENEKQFLIDHPEIFENSDNPKSLIDQISNFTKYHFDISQVMKMALAWAEVTGLYELGLSFRQDHQLNTIADLYLAQGLNKYRIGSFYTMGSTEQKLLLRLKSYFENNGIDHPSKFIPKLWSSIENFINPRVRF